MNREIKFRAWDKEENRMFYDVQNIYDSTYMPAKNEDGTDADDGCYYNSFGGLLRDIEIMVVMQFTGLKDKNEVPIYEGDIVKILYTDWTSEENYYIGKVVWSNDRWSINFGESKWGGDDIGSIKPGEHGWIEVIGNIYSNPELLQN